MTTPAIKYYAPIDLVDQNKIINMGDPTDLQDAATLAAVKAAVNYGVLQAEAYVAGEAGGDFAYFTAPTDVAHLGTASGAGGSTHALAIDGNDSTNAGLSYGATLQVDLGVARAITAWRVYTNGQAQERLLQSSVNGTAWTDRVWTGQRAGGVHDSGIVALANAPIMARYWRLTPGSFDGGSWDICTFSLFTIPPIARYPFPFTGKLEIGFDGSGSPPTPGIRTDYVVPYNMEITGWDVIADATGSVQIDLWKTDLAGYPPVVGDSITGSDKPRLSSEIKASSTALTGWTTTLSEGDCLRINLDSVTTITRATVILSYTRS